MDQASGQHSRPTYGSPPPYTRYGNGPHVSYSVENVSVSVISAPGQFTNQGYSYDPSDPEQRAPPEYTDDLEVDYFSEASVRRGFIRKVYLTLMVQLLITVGIICMFLFWPHLKEWTVEHPWLIYSLSIALPILMLVLICCDSVRRTVPLNFIALGLFTVIEGLMLGTLAALFDTQAVLWAIGATALVSFSVTLFSLQTKWDFTMASGSLWVLGWTVLSYGLLSAILRTHFLHILYACLAALLFSLFLVYDTQVIVGGKHRRFQVSPEEYIFASLSLYLDIVMLFLLLLQIINICR